MKHFFYSFLILFLFSSCKKNDKINNTFDINLAKQSYFATLEILHSNHLSSVATLSKSIQGFCGIPILNRFNESKIYWKSAISDYHKMGPFIFTDASFSNPFYNINQKIGLSNMDESFLDYTAMNGNTGLVYNTLTYPEITSQLLQSWHLQSSQNNITLGYHALEFMLFGEDLSLATEGQRMNDDYIQTDEFHTRRNYLLYWMSVNLESALLELDIMGDFKNQFLNASNEEAINFMFGGMKSFLKNDFKEKVLNLPINNLNNDLELSPYSDNTLEDIKNKINSIRLFFDPSSILTQGNGFHIKDLIEKISPDDASFIFTKLDEMETKVNSINVNFENALLNPAELSKLKSLVTDIDLILSSIDSFISKI